MHTALDILKLNAASDGAQLIEVNKLVAPELTLLPGFTIPGMSFTTVLRTSIPEGEFTDIGAGAAPGASQFANAKVDCYQYKNPVEETNDRASKNRRGLAAFLALTLSGAYRGAIQKFGRTLYYGANATFGGGAKACPGLLDMYDRDNMEVDATGTTDDTASSVWFIKRGDMADGNVNFVFGNNEGLTNFPEWLKAMIVPDPVNAPTKKTLGWQNELATAIGVQLMDKSAVVRIKKLTNEAGKGMTDKLGQLALEKYPVGVTPDFCLMTKRTRRQLQQSRTTPENPRPPLPTDVEGIPIYVTDSLSNVEKLAL